MNIASLLSTFLLFSLLSNVAFCDLVFNLSADTDNSSNSGFGGSVAATLDDPFLYDFTSPTATLPNQVFATGVGFHGSEPAGSIVTVSYTLPSYTTMAGDTIFFDLYGRTRAGEDRDDDYDIVLYNGDYSTPLVTISSQGIADVAPYHLRSTTSLPGGTTFDRFQIIARDSNGADNANFFTLLEIRAGAIAGVPEPSSLFVIGSSFAFFLVRRRK